MSTWKLFHLKEVSGIARLRFWVMFFVICGMGLGGASNRVGATCTAGLMGLPQAPKTFSGTNCLINAWVSTDIGYVTDATIYIGGQQTKTVPNNDPTKTRIDFGVNWDSTHFAHNSSIQLLVVGHNSQGQEGRSNRTFLDKIYNKYSAFFKEEWEDDWATYTAITSFLNATYHNPTRTSQQGWTRQNVMDSVKVDTAFYISTHGDGFLSLYTIEDDFGTWIWPADVSSAMGQRAGTVPDSFRVVYLNACETYDSPTTSPWADAFEISAGSLNQGYVGWYGSPEVVASQKASIEFWRQLRLGQPLSNAIDIANTMYEDNYEGHGEERMIRVGDPSTKLHGVYGIVGETWYR